tara:strand:- start:2952 stop:3608 length:657 start_codon:yes stop_codon:yes gene_type:complete
MIHQIYWDFNGNKTWKDIISYKDNIIETQNFCKVHNYEYKLWDLKDCEKLIDEKYSQYRNLWDNFRFPIQRCDFIRFCILHSYGGLYIDCDIKPVKNLDSVFKDDLYFVYWANDKLKKPYNAIMGSSKGNPLFLDIMEECEKTFIEKSKIKIYNEWKGRFVYQTTGHHFLQKVLKKNKISKERYFHDSVYILNEEKDFEIGNKETSLFFDLNASEWYS